MTVQHLPISQLYEKLDGQLVFDIGANKGSKTQELLELGARVIAVEPQENIKNADYGTATVIYTCISDHDGTVDFFISPMSPISSCKKDWNKTGPYKFDWVRQETQPCRTIDSLIREFGKPFYIKIDVEGYEDYVLKGLTEPIPYISFEYTNGHDKSFKRSLDILKNLGYKKFVMFDCCRDKKKKKYRTEQVFDNVFDCIVYFSQMKKRKAYRGDLLASLNTRLE